MSRRLYIGSALLHLGFVLCICLHDIFSDIGRGLSWLPSSTKPYARKAEALTARALGIAFSSDHPLRAAITAYLYAAGIQAGYGFFAPAVPPSSKLVFELHYEDGHVDYELPRVGDRASSIRLVGLLQHIGRTEYDPLRVMLLKMLAYSVWRDHPKATLIRAVFGYIEQPTLKQARGGATESYHVLYACDFRFKPEETAPTFH